MISQENARFLKELLAPGAALEEVLGVVLAEVESRSSRLVSFDLFDPEALNKARTLQGEIKGGILAVERLKEIINEAAISDR